MRLFLAKRLIIEKSLERADVILVLGGSSVFIERTQKAAEIFKQGVASKILLTDDGEKAGWSRMERRNPPYVELAQKNLVAQGVPAFKCFVTDIEKKIICNCQIF